VAAGAVVAPCTVVKSKQLWAGSPAVYLRDLKVALLFSVFFSFLDTVAELDEI